MLRNQSPPKRKLILGSSVDIERANRAVKFFSSVLTHTKGELGGQAFHLEDWQVLYIARLFGTLNKEGLRQYRTSLLAIPRKNGKSTLCAGIALKMLLENEPGAEIFSCAADREQARLVFEMAKVCVQQSKVLSEKLRVFRNSIVCEETHSTYKALSSQAFTKHGLNAQAVIFDELHAQPNRELWDVMTTSTGARRQPLVVALTTAGFDRKSICWDIWKYALAVRDGAIKDPTFLAEIYAADPEDDWTSPAVWAKANPNLGISVKLEDLEVRCKRAQELTSEQNTFRRLHLNQWTEQDVAWLKMESWAKCGGPTRSPAGREWFAGLDLASTYDTTCLCLVSLDPSDDTYDVVPIFWVPKENAIERERRDRVPYLQWIRDGHVRATEGNVTDYATVIKDILELKETFNIRSIAVDRWNASHAVQLLQESGVECVGYSQGYAMNAPSKQLEALVVSGRIRHAGHPTLAIQAMHCAAPADAYGNIKPSKKKSTERIDGIAALVMALGIIGTTAKAVVRNWNIEEL